MKNYLIRARGAAAVAIAAAGLMLGACNAQHELLQPQQPGVILPSAISSATAADALYAGAMAKWNQAMNFGTGNNQEGLWNWEALFTDELRSSDTFSQRNDDDQRNLATNDGVLTPIYQQAQQARGRARDAINALLKYDTTPTGQQHIGEMYLAMGYVEMEMSAVFCNGIPFGETVNNVPQYTQPLMDADGSKLAMSRIDTALTYLTGSDAGTTNIKNAALITKARALVDLGQFAQAAALVTGIPTSFQYNFNYSQTTFDNEWWVMGPSVKRYNAGDSVDVAGRILNAIPFAELGDPRVQVAHIGVGAGEDGHSDYYQVNNWGRDDPVPVASGIDARLIEAEAKLQGGDIAGMMTILNALRTSPEVIGVMKVPAMAALPTPPDQPSAVQLFFREKALWQFERGYRMDDLRRMVRQYHLAQNQVFPTGPFVRNGTPSGNFGTQVAFPVPDYEMVNPNFHGCIDTNA
ncbi:MAG: hypothetical protein KGN74_09620 [Gemmatimonadota bacterium]|nr:hypothetical protein [Gemmatimonadota bacterium]